MHAGSAGEVSQTTRKGSRIPPCFHYLIVPAVLAWVTPQKIPLNKGGGARFRATGDVKSAEETSPWRYRAIPLQRGNRFSSSCCASRAGMSGSSENPLHRRGGRPLRRNARNACMGGSRIEKAFPTRNPPLACGHPLRRRGLIFILLLCPNGGHAWLLRKSMPSGYRRHRQCSPPGQVVKSAPAEGVSALADGVVDPSRCLVPLRHLFVPHFHNLVVPARLACAVP